MQCCLSLMLLLICLPVTLASLHSHFTHFEILTPRQIHTRTRRDVRTGRVSRKYLNFRSLGRKFKLTLTPGWSGVDNNLDSRLVFANGSTERIQIDLSRVYSGKLDDDVTSSVRAFQYGGEWSAQIEAHRQVYVIEPLRRYEPHSLTKRMVVYRAADVITYNTSEKEGPTCFEIKANHTRNIRIHQKWRDNSGQYRKRSLPRFDHSMQREPVKGVMPNSEKNVNQTKLYTEPRVCDIRVIMDTVCLRNFFHNDISAAVLKALYFGEQAAMIFGRTKFGEYTNMTVKVTALRIHNEFTPKTINKDVFNHRRDTLWHPAKLIEAMWSADDNNRYCTNVLFTANQILEDVLGATYTPSICKGPYATGSGSANCAWVTFNLRGEFVPDARFLTTFVHEMGHQWGSPHDDRDDPVCGSTSDLAGGYYIMDWISNHGTLPNNHKFSPCSRRAIAFTLKDKDASCFLPAQVGDLSVCGNGILEEGEECDQMNLFEKSSKCCDTKLCRLKENARCDPTSSPCCTKNCTAAPVAQTCYNSLSRDPCRKISHCDGVDHKTCPIPEPRQDGVVCGQARLVASQLRINAVCDKGSCISMCETIGRTMRPPRNLVPCQRPVTRSDMCSVFCKDVTSNGSCHSIHAKLLDGSVCFLGTCKGGLCRSSDYVDYKSSVFGDDIYTLAKTYIVCFMVAWLCLSIISSIIRRFVLHR